MGSSTRALVLKLIQEKVKLEKDLYDQHEILKMNNIDMSAPLVDEEGYPRHDIDVYQVRHARHKIICLENDLRSVLKQIEKGLAEVHAERAKIDAAAEKSDNTSSKIKMEHADNVPATPFAVVTMVDNGSPADVAGLCKNDKIIQFGSLTQKNFNNMEEIYSIVKHSVGQPINVQVMRGRLIVGITLTPKPWLNRGLLGCHIQKFEAD